MRPPIACSLHPLLLFLWIEPLPFRRLLPGALMNLSISKLSKTYANGVRALWDLSLRRPTRSSRSVIDQVLERSGSLSVQAKQADGLIDALRAQCLIATTLRDAIRTQRRPSGEFDAVAAE